MLGSACRTTQLAQSVVQESVNLRPAENSEFRPIPPGTKQYVRTTPVLGRRTYELELLIRIGLGFQPDFIPPIKFGDLGSRNSRLLEPRLVA
jgi:hypothetical protein